MRGFKFMSSKHVGSFLSGRLRLGSLDYYRTVEEEEWIADRLEGVSRATGSISLDSRDPEYPKNLARLSQAGMVGADPRATVHGLHFFDCTFEVHAPQVHLFCFSDEPYELVRKAMCDDAPEKSRYDACVEITNLELFVATVMTTGRVDGRAVRDLYHPQTACRPVRYDKVIRDIAIEDMDPLDIFQKPSRFESQRELRFALQPLQAMPETCYVDFEVWPNTLLKRVL